MDVKEFLAIIQEKLNQKEFDKAAAFCEEKAKELRHNTESATMTVLFSIYRSERDLNEPLFFENSQSIPELMNYYNQLKFYLRRYDFDVHYDTLEFVDFVKTNQISSSAILQIAISSTINKVKVLNEAAMTLLEHQEYLKALRILTIVYQNSKDDVTVFNLAQALYCCGKYELAYKMVQLIKEKGSTVQVLKSMIEEKLE